MDFIYEPEFWVAVSFFIFVGVLVYLGVHKKVASALDARALRISKELEEARRLREEAEKLLVDYRRKLGDAVTEVDSIIAFELNCELNGMAKQFFRAECDTGSGGSFAEFSKSALRGFSQRHPEVSLLDDDIWLKFDAVRFQSPKDWLTIMAECHGEF